MVKQRLKNRDFPQYKLIITDINMPVMDGIEATSHIREIEKANKLSPTIIVALSAANIEENPEISQEQGFDEKINKPISKDSFGKLLRRYDIIK